MFESYNPISNLNVTPISDITIERNNLGYLILNSGSFINIPAVVKLYDYMKFKEIIDTTFTEIFPNDVIPPNILDLQAQIVTLNAQVSGSQSEIDNLNSIIDGLQTPIGELELWRTRKTFKRIADGVEGTYPLGFPNINSWANTTLWDSYADSVIKVFGPNVTNEEQVWIDDIKNIASFIQNVYLNDPSNINTLELVTFFNDLAIPGLSISNNTYAPNSITNPTILRLQDPGTVGTVTEQEINILSYQNIPTCYLLTDPGTGNKVISSVQEFRALCKKLVYWRTNGYPLNTFLLTNIYNLEAVQNQLNYIQSLESETKTTNPAFNVNTYFEQIV